MSMTLPKIIVVTGTNASGKSSLGIELAESFKGEIICADSRQIYKGFDLCCGQITAQEAQIVPHHLLGKKTIGETFSVSDFQKSAYSIIPQILDRGRIPFIVGGTGLYVSSVTDGYVMRDDSVDLALRGRLEKLSVVELQNMLTVEAKTFLKSNQSEFNNKRRLIRIIEKSSNGESLNYENEARFNSLRLGVTWPKEKLHERIDERLTARIEQGMIDEVKAYLDGGGRPEYLFELGLEYRYILWYLSGKFASFNEFKDELSRAIKRFAKRQMTWFRRDKLINWLDMTADYLAQARSLISDFLGRAPVDY